MHCPDCGTKASVGQKFCRACGFGLEKVEQLVADQRASATQETTGATGSFSDDWLRKFEKWAERALFALGGIAISLILWAIIFKLMIKEGAIFPGSMLLMLVIGVVLALFLVFMKEKRNNSASTHSNQQHRLPQAQETAKMLSEPNAEMSSSVTEHTTAQLDEKVGTIR
jgi:ribosomal protein L37E